MTGIVGLLLSTALVLMAKSAATPSFATAEKGDIPITTGSCLTCHYAAHSDWSALTDGSLEQVAGGKPHATAADRNAADTIERVMEIGDEGRAYTLEDTTFDQGSSHQPRYVMQTDRGYAVLPSQWDGPGHTWTEADPDDWRVNCTNCHALGIYSGEMTFSDIEVTCVTCHALDDSHPQHIPGTIEFAGPDWSGTMSGER
jgi:hypothetical protein